MEQVSRQSVLRAAIVMPLAAVLASAASAAPGAQSHKASVKTMHDYLIEAAEKEIKRAALLSRDGAAARLGFVKYSSAATFAYASQYCHGGNDCPDDEFPSDCTHFLSHALRAGGIAFKADTLCKSGVCIRVNDLAAAMDNASTVFRNVSKIASYADTQRGDMCFIPKWFGLRKEHAMLLAEKPARTGGAVFAHTNRRCGDNVEFDATECKFYRIADEQ